MDSCELTIAVSALANILAEKYSCNELSPLAAIFTQLGDTLTTIVTRNEIHASSQK